MQDMPLCRGKTKQLLCLHFSIQICSLPPPQPQLSTASQAPQTSSPLPAQVSPSAESESCHITPQANPQPWQTSLSASSPTGKPADCNQWPHGLASNWLTPTTPITSPCSLPDIPWCSQASYNVQINLPGPLPPDPSGTKCASFPYPQIWWTWNLHTQ